LLDRFAVRCETTSLTDVRRKTATLRVLTCEIDSLLDFKLLCCLIFNFFNYIFLFFINICAQYLIKLFALRSNLPSASESGLTSVFSQRSDLTSVFLERSGLNYFLLFLVVLKTVSFYRVQN